LPAASDACPSLGMDSSSCTCCWAEGLPGVEKGGKMARPLTLSGLPRSLTCFSFTVPSSTTCTHTMLTARPNVSGGYICNIRTSKGLCVRHDLAPSLRSGDSRRAHCLSAAIKIMLVRKSATGGSRGTVATIQHQIALLIW